jgi:hypothetical protein
MFALISSLLGSSLLGSIVGAWAAWLKGKQELAVRSLELEHESKRWAFDLEIAREEAKTRKDIAFIESDGEIEQSRMQAMAQAVAADAVTADEVKAQGPVGKIILGIISAIQKLVRPTLTAYLVYSAVVLNAIILDNLPKIFATMGVDKQYDMTMYGLSWVFAQASACLGYWFFQRSNSGSPPR